MKKIIKSILFAIGIDITQNQKYDRQTLQIMSKSIKPNSNCIDIGCHKGEMLEIMFKHAPQGKHYAFEPIPQMYDDLLKNFNGPNFKIFPIALCETKGETTFNHVKNAPAYSGIKQREYNIKNPEISQITVKTDLLDNIIPSDEKIDFIKIDVEGAELNVLKGAEKTIIKNQPLIIFECGIGASDYYNTKPEEVFEFLTINCGLKISLLIDWLKSANSLSLDGFCENYSKKINYYFVAHP
ncbi:MAG: FkbM family methyltransferase [Bacteroidetes bacterium]|nr:FkbM family methyltransferase [Bacteroidota bacterium]